MQNKDIAVTTSAITYPTCALCKPVDGTNFPDGKYVKVKTWTYNESSNNGVYITKFNDIAPIPYVRFLHVYGTITRKSLTDNTAFYQISNDGPIHDQVTLIPADPFSLTTYVDWWEISAENPYYYRVWIHMKTFDKDYNAIQVANSVSLTYEYYS